MIGRAHQLGAAWFEAHQELRAFLETWLDIEVARTMASRALGIWVQQALDGVEPPLGPYANLFVAAHYCLTAKIDGRPGPSREEAWLQAPMDRTLLPYQVAKIHTDLWKAGQLLAWDMRTIHRVSRGLSLVWPSSATHWTTLDPGVETKLVGSLLRCAVESLSEHRCVDCLVCAEHALRWEKADERTEQWFTARRLNQEG